MTIIIQGLNSGKLISQGYGSSSAGETVVRLTATTRQQITAVSNVQITAEAG